MTHSTLSDTNPYLDGSGGTWFVTCGECLWSKNGAYAQTDPLAEYVALRLATFYGEQHEAEQLTTVGKDDH